MSILRIMPSRLLLDSCYRAPLNRNNVSSLVFAAKQSITRVPDVCFLRNAANHAYKFRNLSTVSRNNNRLTFSFRSFHSIRNVNNKSADSVKKTEGRPCPALPANGNGIKPTLAQRFKAAYRQYGKVLLVVHLALSLGWYGTFYVIASSGFDVAALLENWGFTNERLTNALRSSAGSAAVAYLLYKLASPVRYAVTLGGTHLAVMMLRRLGYLRSAALSKAK